MRVLLSILISASVFLSACQKSSGGGTSTGNPMVSFKMAGSSAPATNWVYSPFYKTPWLAMLLSPALALPPPSLQDANGASLTLTEAWIVVKEVEFKSSEESEVGEVDGAEISFEGPYVVDLLTDQPESFGQARLGTSVLRRVKMKLHNADTLPAGAPAEMINKSVYWKGVINGHAFTIASEEGYEYELSGANGIALAENSNILMSIHIANLFKKINLSGISSDVVIDQQNRLSATNPCPLINASASDIYTCFTDGLKSESNLGHDADGDDELGETDDSVK